MKFNTIEEATAQVDSLNTEVKDLKLKLSTSEKSLQTANVSLKNETAAKNLLATELAETKDLLVGAKEIAADAMEKVQSLEDAQPKKLTAKVNGLSYEVIFGVDGLSKEELAEDKAKVALLAKTGSSAVKLMEGK